MPSFLLHHRSAYDRAESTEALGPLWSGLRAHFGLKTDIGKRPRFPSPLIAHARTATKIAPRRGCLKILLCRLQKWRLSNIDFGLNHLDSKLAAEGSR